MSYAKHQDGKVIFNCSQGNKFCEIQIKDGQIVRTYGGTVDNWWDNTHRQGIAFYDMIKISIECYCEMVQMLNRKSKDYEIAIKLLKEEQEKVKKQFIAINKTLKACNGGK